MLPWKELSSPSTVTTYLVLHFPTLAKIQLAGEAKLYPLDYWTYIACETWSRGLLNKGKADNFMWHKNPALHSACVPLTPAWPQRAPRGHRDRFYGMEILLSWPWNHRKSAYFFCKCCLLIFILSCNNSVFSFSHHTDQQPLPTYEVESQQQN